MWEPVLGGGDQLNPRSVNSSDTALQCGRKSVLTMLRCCMHTNKADGRLWPPITCTSDMSLSCFELLASCTALVALSTSCGVIPAELMAFDAADDDMVVCVQSSYYPPKKILPHTGFPIICPPWRACVAVATSPCLQLLLRCPLLTISRHARPLVPFLVAAVPRHAP